MKEIRITKNQDEEILLNDTADEIKVVIEKGVTANIIEAESHKRVEVEVMDDAVVNYHFVYSGTGDFFKEATLLANAQINWRSAVIGGNNNHAVSTLHQGAGSTSTHNGIFIGREKDKIGLNYWSEHSGMHTNGSILVHGILLDSAYADFLGNIKIAETGIDTDASLVERTLLLGEKARSDSVPQLEISTDDVRAAHSSSVSRIDDEQLFYLQSRGIPKDLGRRLIIEGFLQDVVNSFIIDRMKNEVEKIIEERISYDEL
ncbi:MAG: SufD family Fe-S cluster assembly protein [bacterium]|nr:SufD family Fe-S cluster assembly protein [bacterium]